MSRRGKSDISASMEIAHRSRKLGGVRHTHVGAMPHRLSQGGHLADMNGQRRTRQLTEHHHGGRDG
jgi:hypothetical protein